MITRTLTVVTAGLSQPSSTRLLADRLAEASARALGEQDVHVDTEVIELRSHAKELADHLLTGFPAGGLRTAIDRVTNSDGLIAVTPIFTASYSGLFKMFFDVLDADALAGLPVLVGATGGTARHSLALDHALRPMFGYLRAVVVPTGVYAASEDWGTGGGDNGLVSRIDRAAGELAGLIAGRPAARTATDPFDDPVPFSQLLGRTEEP
ncbi:MULTISPECIES: FMN reductase [Actinoalloteichus]|uniref:LLM-partnered FMN reductase, CE1759 family n=1 Tax=Actinoalloteichus fjordicus TaxID=1612552 RepID=A0AAC9PT25_9PSEU|nr:MULTISPECIES: FMN reductase [Actinoalloteichus]APU15607.1 LLM-partnered FMN reductase, CE1759 family [Actinoalloteichus fjordicus]APU21667.1 LLM-partnered FMN reductase, CE1759 family [Actinoalloteichus sp. GBA129-24]